MICSSRLPTEPLDQLPIGPQVRRWATATVRELLPLLPRGGERPGRRLLALFIDGLGEDLLTRGAHDGTLPFLGALRDSRRTRLSPAFSGMPSTTTAFQAGLFYGLDHPDIPAFGWWDRKARRIVQMNRPADARAIEGRISASHKGLMEGGSSYLSILRGGASDRLNTAGAGEILAREALPLPALQDLPALASIHLQTTMALAARLALETGGFLWEMLRFIGWSRSRRHEANFLLNHLLVGTLLKEVSQGQAILDLVGGVPRVFLNLHDFDEASHRRGPEAARKVLLGIDRTIERLYALAAASPNPPDVWVFSDHGQIPSVPMEKRFGCSLKEWLRGAGDGTGPLPRLPDDLAPRLGAVPGDGPSGEPEVVDGGNYAHIYLGGDEPRDGSEIVEGHQTLLRRLFACPAVGLVALRHGEGALAFGPGGRIIDPDEPHTVPGAVSPLAVRALLDDLVHSPSAGDLVVYGAWLDGGCVAFSWEFSSHGGPSLKEIETFVIHPVALPFELPPIRHGADLHRIFDPLYGDGSHGP